MARHWLFLVLLAFRAEAHGEPITAAPEQSTAGFAAGRAQLVVRGAIRRRGTG
jgi:hypothetical protein